MFTGCALHDAQNGFKRPLLEWMGDADCVRNVHVAVQSVRNSMDLIVRHVGLWVARALRFRPVLTSDETNDLQCLWNCLGLEPELVDLLSETLQLRWRDGVLLVSEQLQGTDCVGLATNTLLTVWRFRQFTDSRWLLVGTTGRALTAAHLTGLPHLVQHTLNDPKSSHYYLGGFRRLQKKEWAFMVHAAVASRPMDAVLLMLMEDSRVLPQLEALKSALHEEMDWMARLPHFVWAALAEVGSLPSHELRDRCLAMGHASVCLFYCRVIHVAEGPPFNLALGCIKDKLHLLSQQPEPVEFNVKKVWCLLQCGICVDTVARLVTLFLELPWTTLNAEQLHGIAAALRRHHPEYALGTLLSRSTVLTAHKLLPKVSQEDRQLDKLYAKEKKLERKNPNKASGRQLYLQELHEAARAKVGSQGRPLSTHQARLVMKKHGQSYAQKARFERVEWETRARVRAQEKRETIQSALQGLKAEIMLQRQRATAKAMERAPIMLRACAWGDEELQLFSAFLRGDDFNRRVVQALRAELEEAPEPVAEVPIQEASELVVDDAGVPQASWLGPVPAWLHQLCARRSAFLKTALVWESAGDQAVAKFMYALQQPSFVGVSLLKEPPSDELGCPDDGAPAGSAISAMWWKWRLKADWGSHVSLASIAPKEADRIWVLPNLVHDVGRSIVSGAALIPLPEYLTRFPAETTQVAARKKQHQRSDSTREELLKAHPWLAETLDPGETDTGVEAKPLLPLDCETDGESEEGEDETALDEAAIDAAFRDLEAKRADDEHARLVAGEDFRVALLGGAASQRDRGLRDQTM